MTRGGDPSRSRESRRPGSPGRPGARAGPPAGLVVIGEFRRRPDLLAVLSVLADRRRRPARFLVMVNTPVGRTCLSERAAGWLRLLYQAAITWPGRRAAGGGWRSSFPPRDPPGRRGPPGRGGTPRAPPPLSPSRVAPGRRRGARATVPRREWPRRSGRSGCDPARCCSSSSGPTCTWKSITCRRPSVGRLMRRTLPSGWRAPRRGPARERY